MKTKLQYCCILLALLAGVHPTAMPAATVFPIATNPAVIAYGAGIAFDGTNYLVEMLTGTNGSSFTNLSVQLVSPSGALIGSQTIVGGGAKIQSSSGLGLVFGKTNYLATWSDKTISSGVDMFGQFISPTGAKVGSKFNLLQSQGAHGFQTVEALVTDGTNFLTVWQDGANNNLYGQLATPSGSLSGSEFLLGSQLQGGASAAATFGLTNYFIVWQSNVGVGVGNSNQVYGQFISANGSAGSPFQISQTASTDQNFLAVAFDGTNYLAVWPWDPGPETEMNVTNWQFYARLVSQSGTLSGNEINLITNRNDVIPSLAFDGTDYLLTYGFDSNTTNSDRNLLCQFIDRSANLAGPSFTPFPTMQGTNVPAFALNGILFDGNRFVVAATVGTVGGFAETYGAFIPSSTASPALTASNHVGTQFPLLLTGTPGINYAIQINTNLALNSWTAVFTNSPTNGSFSFTDTSATNKSRFYRAMKQ